MCHNKAKNIENARRIGTFRRCFANEFGNVAKQFLSRYFICDLL